MPSFLQEFAGVIDSATFGIGAELLRHFLQELFARQIWFQIQSLGSPVQNGTQGKPMGVDFRL